MQSCPLCGQQFTADRIAAHVERCLWEQQQNHPSSSSAVGGVGAPRHPFTHGGKTKLDFLHEQHVAGNLSVDGFRELSKSGTAANAEGILQLCVFGVQVPQKNVAALRGVKQLVSSFEGESVTHSLRRNTRTVGSVSVREVQDPKTVSMLVHQYYAPSKLECFLVRANVQTSCFGRWRLCFGSTGASRARLLRSDSRGSSSNTNTNNNGNSQKRAHISLGAIRRNTAVLLGPQNDDRNTKLLPGSTVWLHQYYENNSRPSPSAATLSIRVWLRYIPASEPLEELKSLLCNAIREGDSTTTGLLCHLNQMGKFLHSSSARSFLRRVLVQWDPSSDNDTVKQDTHQHLSVSRAPRSSHVLPNASDQAERRWWEEDEDRNNTAGNTFCVDHRAALQILLREIEKGTCFSQFSSARNSDQDNAHGSLLHFAVAVAADSAIVAEESHAIMPGMLEKSFPPSNLTPFLLACAHGKLKMARFLATQGIRIARRPVTAENGDTALMLAARAGHVAIVHWLLSKEADPNLRNDSGSAPLDVSVGFKKDDVAADTTLALLAGGALVCLAPGNRVLHTAARQGNAQTLRILVEAAVEKNKGLRKLDVLAIRDPSWHTTPFELAMQGTTDGHREMHQWIHTMVSAANLGGKPVHQWEGVVGGIGGAMARRVMLVDTFGSAAFDYRRPSTSVTPQDAQVKAAVETKHNHSESEQDSEAEDADVDDNDDGCATAATAAAVTASVDDPNGAKTIWGGTTRPGEHPDILYKSFSPLECEAFLNTICDKFIRVVDLPKTARASVYSYLALHDWNLANAVQEWSGQTEKTEMPAAFQTHDATSLCPICGESDMPLLRLNACTHAFCKTCWSEYANFTMKEVGSEAVVCPHHSCGMIVDTGALVMLLPTPSDHVEPPELTESRAAMPLPPHLLLYKIRRFVQVRRDLACFCPSPGCEDIIVWPSVLAVTAPRGQGCAVQCARKHAMFCFHCGQESHTPASCDAWSEFRTHRDKDEALLSKWLYNNTKVCSSCGTRVEKNKGCKHITCKCGHEFCWDCNQAWSLHDETTGGFFRCNLFRPDEELKLMGQGEAKEVSTLEKFTVYLKRFNDEEGEEQRVRTLLDALEKAMLGGAYDAFPETATNINERMKKRKSKRRVNRNSLLALQFNFALKRSASGQLQYQMNELVQRFEMADDDIEQRRRGHGSRVDVGLSRSEVKIEDMVLQEEKTHEERSRLIKGSKTLDIYVAALRELLAFFNLAKYVYVALFSAQEGPKHSPVQYMLKGAELQASRLLQLLRPSLLDKIMKQRETIARLTRFLQESRKHLMEDYFIYR